MMGKSKQDSWRHSSMTLSCPSTSWQRARKTDRSPEQLDAKKIVVQWNILSDLLVAEPESEVFKHPLRQPLLSGHIYARWRRQQVFALVFVSCSLIGQLIWTLWVGPTKALIGVSIAITIMLAILYWDFLKLKAPNLVAERSEFLSHFLNNKFLFIPPLILLVISVFFLNAWETGDAMVYAVGSLPANIEQGEFWRLVTGPLAHSGYEHLILNYTIILILFPLACTDGWKIASTVLVLGAVISHAAYFVLHQYNFVDSDVLLGISGGTCSLAAFATLSAKFSTRYPYGFWFCLLALLCLFLIPPAFINPRNSNTAHLAGTLVGAMLFIIYWLGNKSSHNQSANPDNQN